MRRRFLSQSAIGVIVDERLQANREIKVVLDSSRRAQAGCSKVIIRAMNFISRVVQPNWPSH